MNRGSYKNTSGRGWHPVSENSRNSNLVRTIISLVLAVALAITLVIAVPAINYRNDVKDLYIERIQKECDTAVTYSRYLSRTASSNSNAQLATIRSSIYSIDVLNQTYASLEGNGTTLVSDSLLSSIYTTIENYYNKLTTGTNTSDQQTELSNELEALQTAAAALH